MEISTPTSGSMSMTPQRQKQSLRVVSNAQLIADCVAQWSLDNRVQLNSEKCKEL